MNVLFAALELAPYVQTTPAAEAITSLAKALRLLGHDVSVCVPRVPDYEAAGLLAARQLSSLPLSNGKSTTVYSAQLPSGVALSLFEIDIERPEASDAKPLHEQASLLGQYSRAVAALVARQISSESPFDIVHAHDAAAGLALLQVHNSVTAGDHIPGRVLTVHDAERAGVFPASDRETLGIPEERASAHDFATTEGLCLLKGLVPEADAIIIPSESYGRQMKAPEKYGALSRAFQAVDLHGIREGVDHAVYNPATDPSLASRFDAADPTNKGRNKSDLLKKLKLDMVMSRPLLFVEDVPHGAASLDTLLGALPALVRADVTLIVSGSEAGKRENQELLEPLSPQVVWLTQMTPVLRRRILAASDFYLSLFRRVPSGQRLLQAGRYGAVPIAFRADAVTDLVVDADAELMTGTGLIFESMTQRALLNVIARALSAYRSRAFMSLVNRVMRQDLGWDGAARRHVQVYRQAASLHA